MNLRSDENFARLSYRDNLSEAQVVQRINRNWGDTLDKNLAVARDVLKLRVSQANYDELGLPFQYSWFRRMIKIGKHSGINDPNNYEILPNTRSTLYQIALLSHTKFFEAKRIKLIHPRTTAKEVEQFRKRGCKSNFLVKLTITEAGTLDDNGDEQTPDEEMIWDAISALRAVGDYSRHRVQAKVIISDRISEERAKILMASRHLTPAQIEKIQESIRGYRRTESFHLPLGGLTEAARIAREKKQTDEEEEALEAGC